MRGTDTEQEEKEEGEGEEAEKDALRSHSPETSAWRQTRQNKVFIETATYSPEHY